MGLITRLENGSPLSISQMDNNFTYLESISGGVIIKGDYSSNTDAINAGLIDGDYYRYYDVDKDIYHVAVVRKNTNLSVVILSSVDDNIISILSNIDNSGSLTYSTTVNGITRIAKNTDNDLSYAIVYNNNIGLSPSIPTFDLGTIDGNGEITNVISDINFDLDFGINSVSYENNMVGLVEGYNFTVGGTNVSSNGNGVTFSVTIVNFQIYAIDIINCGTGYEINDILMITFPSGAFAGTSGGTTLEITVTNLNNYAIGSFFYVGSNNFYLSISSYTDNINNDTIIQNKIYNINSEESGYSIIEETNFINFIAPNNIFKYNENIYTLFFAPESFSYTLVNELPSGINEGLTNEITFGEIPDIAAFKVINLSVSVINNIIYTIGICDNKETNEGFAYLGKLNISNNTISFVKNINSNLGDIITQDLTYYTFLSPLLPMYETIENTLP